MRPNHLYLKPPADLSEKQRLASAGCHPELEEKELGRALRDPLQITLIINGPLGMSAGKIAAQSFQAAQRLFARASEQPELTEALRAWEREGTCTCTRIARTQHLFQRACEELDGPLSALMIDEGLTEIAPGSPTILAYGPLRRSQSPRLLSHKNIPLLREERG